MDTRTRQIIGFGLLIAGFVYLAKKRSSTATATQGKVITGGTASAITVTKPTLATTPLFSTIKK